MTTPLDLDAIQARADWLLTPSPHRDDLPLEYDEAVELALKVPDLLQECRALRAEVARLKCAARDVVRAMNGDRWSDSLKAWVVELLRRELTPTPEEKHE